MALSRYNFGAAVLVAVASFAVDQLSKYYVTDIMGLFVGEARVVVPGFVTFILSKNYGINFGLFEGMSKHLLIGLSVFFSIALLIWALRRWKDGWFAVGVGLVVGGALGNGFDRTMYGAVTDFLNVTCCGINNPFAFNIADVTIFIGMAVLLIRTSGDDARAAKD